MRTTRYVCLFVLNTILATCLLPGSVANAQGLRSVRLHDSARDEAAAKAAESAAKLLSGSVFETELKNLEVVGKLQMDSIFAGHARTLRNNSAVVATASWTTIETVIVGNLESKIANAGIPEKIKAIEVELGAQREVLRVLKSRAAPASPTLPGNPAETVAAFIEKGIDTDKAILALLKQPGGPAEAVPIVELIGKILAEGKTAASAVAANQAGVTALAKQLLELKIDLDGIAVQRLELEIAHLEKLLIVWQRALGDVERSKSRIEGFRAQVRRMSEADRAKASFETIRTAASRINLVRAELAALPEGSAGAEKRQQRQEVEAENRKTLDAALNAVFLAASLSARWDSPLNIAKLRADREGHRYGIMRNRLEARAFEVALGSGTQRLALFYKGGIRPEMIAQILQAAATASISGTIAATR